MKRLLLLSLLVLLAATVPAAAKSLKAVQVCGESECRSVPRSELRGHNAFGWVFGGGNGVGGELLPAGAERFRVAVTVGAGTDGRASEVIRLAVAPSAGYVRSNSFHVVDRRRGMGADEPDLAAQVEARYEGLGPAPHAGTPGCGRGLPGSLDDLLDDRDSR